MSTPDLTVIVPVYNGMPYLVETVNSILVQKHPNFELLLINDGSTDGGASQAYLDSLTDPRVRVIHKANEGLCDTLNFAFREAHGRYVARLDQDDLCAPERLEKQFTYLEKHPDVAVVFCHTHKIGGKKVWKNPDKMSNETAQGLVKSYDALEQGSLLHSTMMGKRDVFLDVGGYRQAYYPSDDYDLGLRITEQYTAHILPEALVLYRFHAGANTYKYFDKMQMTSRWAKDNAIRRRAGLEERPFEEYIQEAKRSRWKHFNRKRKDAAKYHIRQAGQYFLDGQYLRVIVPFFLGALFDPRAIYNRFARTSRNIVSSSLLM